MASLGTLTVDIVARTGGFIRGMDKAEATSKKWKRKVKRDLAEVSSQMKTLATVGIAGIVGGFGAVVAASGKQADAIRQVETRLKSTGGAAGKTSEELQKMASALQNVTRFGDETILEMQSVLLTFTNIEGQVFDRTVPAILDLSTAMGQSLQSSAVQLGKALNDPIKGLSALSRVGIQFTDDQKAVIESLVETGDVAAAQNVILEELERQFGGSAVAAGDTFVGALTQVKNAFGDLLENAGGLEDNKEALQELVDFLQDPETVASARALTGALINGFTTVADKIRETVGLFQFLGEEFARIRFGAASDDLVRLNEELDKAKAALDGGFTDRVRFFGPGGIVEYWDEDELKAEIKKIEDAIVAEEKRIADRVRRAAGVSRPVPTPTTANGPITGGGTTTGGTPGGAPTPGEAADDLGEFGRPQETFELGDPSALAQIEAAIQAKKDQYAKEQELARENQEKLGEIREEGQEFEFNLISQASSDILGVIRAFSDESSGIYQAAFALQKSVAVAESIIAIQAALAKAANNPFPANLAAMATVAAQTAGIVATISGTRIQGQAHDGMMSVPKTGTYMLEQGERVVPAETTAKMDSMIDEARSGSGGIRIINAFDSQEVVGDFIGSSPGEKAVMNVVRRNQRTIKALAAV
jgi:hypothetical protein